MSARQDAQKFLGFVQDLLQEIDMHMGLLEYYLNSEPDNVPPEELEPLLRMTKELDSMAQHIAFGFCPGALRNRGDRMSLTPKCYARVLRGPGTNPGLFLPLPFGRVDTTQTKDSLTFVSSLVDIVNKRLSDIERTTAEPAAMSKNRREIDFLLQIGNCLAEKEDELFELPHPPSAKRSSILFKDLALRVAPALSSNSD